MGKRPPDQPGPGRARGGWAALGALAAVITGLAAIALGGYQFGIGDQAQYLVQVIHLEEPAALAGDPYVGVFDGLRSVFWPAIAALTDEAGRPAFCLILAVAAAVANALLAMGLGRTLLGEGLERGPAIAVAALAVPLTLAVTKEGNWFGLVSLSDVEVTATSMVMPLVFATMVLWVRGRWLAALAAAAVAVPVHGQVGAYLLSAWWAATLLSGGTRGGRWRGPALVATGALGAAALAVEAAGDLAAIEPGRHETLGRWVFAALVDPWSVPGRAWASVGAVLGLGLAAARPWAGAGGDGPGRRLLVWGVASCALPIVGLALLALPGSLPVLPKLMVGRALMLPQIVALVFIGTWAARTIALDRGPAWRSVVSVLVLAAVAAWPFPKLPTAPALVALVGLAVAILATTWVWPTPAAREARWGRAAVGAATVLALVAALAGHAALHRPFPWLASGDDAAWLEAQAWARARTPPGTLFLTPPYQGNWRVASHRPTFGELKDGGLSFYTPACLERWVHRMSLLRMAWESTALTGGRYDLDDQRRAYRRAVRDGLDAIRHAADVTHVVTESAFDVEVGTVVWRNDRYVIRRLRSEQ